MRIHSHMLDLLRSKLGRKRADRLVHDALGDRHADILALERAAGLSTYRNGRDDDRILTVISRASGGARWHGSHLFMPHLFPESVVMALPGMMIEDAVAGSGLSGVRIASAWRRVPHRDLDPELNPAGTGIEVESVLLGRDAISLGPAALRLAGLRRGWNTLRIAALGQYEERLDMPVMESLPNIVGMVLIYGIILIVMVVMVVIRDAAAGPVSAVGTFLSGIRRIRVPKLRPHDSSVF